MQLIRVSKYYSDKLRTNAIFIGVALAIGLASAGVTYWLSGDVANLEGNTAEYSALQSSITQKEAEAASLTDQIVSTGTSLTGDFMTKEEFIEFIGGMSEQLGVELTRYTGGDVVNNEGINYMNFQFEVRGLPRQVSNMTKAIDNLNTPYIVNSVSLRREDEFVWSDRELISIIEWFDSESIADRRPYSAFEEAPTIGVMDFLSPNNVKMLVDMSFVTSDTTPDGVETAREEKNLVMDTEAPEWEGALLEEKERLDAEREAALEAARGEDTSGEDLEDEGAVTLPVNEEMMVAENTVNNQNIPTESAENLLVTPDGIVAQ
jgi:hypothetical protein